MTFTHDYKSRLLSLELLTLMMQLELYDIMFFIRCLKDPSASNSFPVESYVHFSSGYTRSAIHLKLKHSLSKTNTVRHLYFNRLPRLWNALPPINLDHNNQEAPPSDLVEFLHFPFSKFQSMLIPLPMSMCEVCKFTNMYILLPYNLRRASVLQSGVPSVHNLVKPFYLSFVLFIVYCKATIIIILKPLFMW